ncbi:MAG: 50S ribosomal protein L13 [Candidatus Omnitrophota bacterium]
MKTYIARKQDVEARKWYLADAKGKILGRLAVKVARILMGKNKPIYTPFVDCGDGVVVINAKNVVVTGRKLSQKKYTTYSGYPGGLKIKNMETMLKDKPEEVFRHAVKGMLPKNKLGDRMFSRLKVYIGAEQPHNSQSLLALE